MKKEWFNILFCLACLPLKLENNRKPTHVPGAVIVLVILK